MVVNTNVKPRNQYYFNVQYNVSHLPQKNNNKEMHYSNLIIFHRLKVYF